MQTDSLPHMLEFEVGIGRRRSLSATYWKEDASLYLTRPEYCLGYLIKIHVHVSRREILDPIAETVSSSLLLSTRASSSVQ